jgi:molybdopterin-guanine dinucleotide biosynthesis protein B
MKVVGFAGNSGSGKTTLIEHLIPEMRLMGLRVSVVKHAHHRFDVDHAGKDTFRPRMAGAFEVVAASDQRLALMREFEQPVQLNVHQLICELTNGVDWVFVEGFKDAEILKIEVWRTQSQQAVLSQKDDFIVAIATDSPDQLPASILRPVLNLNDAPSIALWLIAQEARFDYRSETYS